VTLSNTIALGILFAAIATMPIFALVSRSRPTDADVARRPTTVLLGFWVRDWLMWLIGPVERALVRAKVSPDVFNYLGVAFGICAGVAFAWDELGMAGLAILFGGLADVFDGRIARARGLTNSYGEFMDSTLDRFSETFSFVGVAWYLSSTPWGVAVAVMAVGGSLLVSYTRAKGESMGVRGAGGVMQRAERLVLLALGGLSDAALTARFNWPPGSILTGAVTLIAVGSTGTAIYRTAYIARTLARKDL
jgi:phosphatidylglycerophosphate synthase